MSRTAPLEPSDTPSTASTDLIALVSGAMIVVFWAAPVVISPGLSGVFDWDVDMQRFEALRRTIVEFGQWPGNNPWIEGGQPLVAIPFLLSIRGLLVLALGTFWGLRISVAVHLILGFIGAWTLAGTWWRERFIRFTFALFTIANPAAAYMLTVGHGTYQNFWFMPWLLYFLLRAREDRWSGLKAGLAFGLALTEHVPYIMQVGGLVLAGLFAWRAVCDRTDARAFGRWALRFVLMVGASVFYRVVTLFEIARDYARVNDLAYHYDLKTWLTAYLSPMTTLDRMSGATNWCGSAWELDAYLGITSVLLFALSLTWGFRWWHTLSLVMVWAAIGDDSAWHLTYWLKKAPSFNSWICFSRLRVFVPLFLGVGATHGLHILWNAHAQRRLWRYVGILLAIIMAGEVLVVSHLIMRHSQSAESYKAGDQNPGMKFRTVGTFKGGDSGSNIFSYEATRMNLGWLNYGDSNLPGHNKDVVKGFDEPGYIAEFHQGGKPVEPVYWSPNRIVLQGLDPAAPLVANMNTGRAWFNNGVPLFPGSKIVDVDRPFLAMPNAAGVVELTYRYPGQALGVWGSLVFALLLIAVVGLDVRAGRHALHPATP